jgi:hypothetical protein
MYTKLTDSLKGYRKFTFLGLILAAATMVVLVLLPSDKGVDLLAILLAAVGAIYIGSALANDRPGETKLETGAALITILLALGGLWLSPYLLAIGYFLHGAWDILHHPEVIKTRIAKWVPPFCLVYDWLIAAFILLWWPLAN